MSADEQSAQARAYAAVVRGHGDARAVAYADGVLGLICDRAHPPGRPLALVVQLPAGEQPLTGKALGSKQREDGSFDVRLRLSSLRREQRAALEAAFARSQASDS